MSSVYSFPPAWLLICLAPDRARGPAPSRGGRSIRPNDPMYACRPPSGAAPEDTSLATTVHSHLVAQRAMIEAIVRAAGSDRHRPRPTGRRLVRAGGWARRSAADGPGRSRAFEHGLGNKVVGKDPGFAGGGVEAVAKDSGEGGEEG